MIHTIILYIALAWTTLLLVVSAVLVIRAGSLMVRVLALDTFTLIQVALLVLFAHLTSSVYYLDAALLLALLAFVGTLAAARYYSEGRMFS
jgi:multicomponent Na+:H+ antiporter subunit F